MQELHTDTDCTSVSDIASDYMSVTCSPKAGLEIVRTNTVLIVRWGSECDRKVAEQDIEHRLRSSASLQDINERKGKAPRHG